MLFLLSCQTYEHFLIGIIYYILFLLTMYDKSHPQHRAFWVVLSCKLLSLFSFLRKLPPSAISVFYEGYISRKGVWVYSVRIFESSFLVLSLPNLKYRLSWDRLNSGPRDELWIWGMGDSGKGFHPLGHTALGTLACQMSSHAKGKALVKPVQCWMTTGFKN